MTFKAALASLFTTNHLCSTSTKETREQVMAELNAHSDRMVLVFNCKVKNADDFKAWSKDRAAKYV